MSSEHSRLKIIALGNILCGDDGVGPLVIEQLRRRGVPDDITLIDAGSDAFLLLDHLQSDQPVILIDSAKMGRAPGTVVRFSIDDATFRKVNEAISLHGFSFADVYHMARNLGAVADCTFIGIEPGTVAFNHGLSPVVEASMPQIMAVLTEEIERHEEKNNHH